MQSDVAHDERKEKDEDGSEHEVTDNDERKHEDVGEHEGEDSEAGGLGMSSHEHWPSWPCDEGESAWPKELAWNFEVDTPIKMLLWTDWGFLTEKSAASLPNCEFDRIPYTMGIPSDLNVDTSDYDVIIFHMSNLHWGYPEYYKIPQSKPEGQVWIAACGEPFDRPGGVDCSLLNDTTVMKNFDYTSTFSLGSDFPAIQDPIIESVMRLDIPDFASRGPELATMVFSDCHAGGREEWATKLMKSFEDRGRGDAVLSYGGCMHNAQEPACDGDQEAGLPGSYHRWINRCGSRPFKIVMENIQEPWYVSEKIWDALAEGAIPVYWGGSEVKRWMPEGSFLDVSDFPSTNALVDKMLSFTEADFAAAYAWKTQPASEWEGWMKAWRLSHYTLVPRLCEAAAKGKQSGGKWLTPDKE